MRADRVNKLIRREVSSILHSQFQVEATCITVLDVNCTPDLKQAHIYYSVFGDMEVIQKCHRFFTRNHKLIRHYLGKRIALKYLPELHFKYDESAIRGNRVMALLDELDEKDKALENNAPGSEMTEEVLQDTAKPSHYTPVRFPTSSDPQIDPDSYEDSDPEDDSDEDDSEFEEDDFDDEADDEEDSEFEEDDDHR